MAKPPLGSGARFKSLAHKLASEPGIVKGARAIFEADWKAQALAAAGKPVFCEKPLALNLDDALAMVRACRKAGVPEWNPYQLRHLNAEEIDARLGLDAVQHALGHSSAQTSRRYAKRSLAGAIDAAKKMSG